MNDWFQNVLGTSDWKTKDNSAGLLYNFCCLTNLVGVREENDGHVHVRPNLLTFKYGVHVTQIDGGQAVARWQVDDKALPVRDSAHHNAFVFDNPQNLGSCKKGTSNNKCRQH